MPPLQYADKLESMRSLDSGSVLRMPNIPVFAAPVFGDQQLVEAPMWAAPNTGEMVSALPKTADEISIGALARMYKKTATHYAKADEFHDEVRIQTHGGNSLRLLNLKRVKRPFDELISIQFDGLRPLKKPKIDQHSEYIASHVEVTGTIDEPIVSSVETRSVWRPTGNWLQRKLRRSTGYLAPETIRRTMTSEEIARFKNDLFGVVMAAEFDLKRGAKSPVSS